MPHHSHHKHVKNKNNVKLITQIVLILAVVEPLMTLPQVYEVWVRHQTEGVSIATWTFFALSAATWLLYGIAIKNTPLIVSGTLWIILETSVVIGLLIY